MKRPFMKRLLFLAFLLPAPAQPPPSPTFKVDVKLVRLLVTVKNRQGALVGALDRNDFSVYDCGVKQDLAVFERQTELPLSISVLIDTSGSTAKDVRYETTSVEKFFKALLGEGNSKDAAALYGFNYDVTLLQGFTRSSGRLNENLRSLKPSGYGGKRSEIAA